MPHSISWHVYEISRTGKSVVVAGWQGVGEGKEKIAKGCKVSTWNENALKLRLVMVTYTVHTELHFE
jgi:hypothetical protein